MRLVDHFAVNKYIHVARRDKRNRSRFNNQMGYDNLFPVFPLFHG
jgi:hypothetical protein